MELGTKALDLLQQVGGAVAAAGAQLGDEALDVGRQLVLLARPREWPALPGLVGDAAVELRVALVHAAILDHASFAPLPAARAAVLLSGAALHERLEGEGGVEHVDEAGGVEGPRLVRLRVGVRVKVGVGVSRAGRQGWGRRRATPARSSP